MTRGFLVLAQDIPNSVTYLNCARALAKSIKKVMPNANISIVTDNPLVDKTEWDQVIALPFGDLDKDKEWKLTNEWQLYEASPYDETIKIDADIFIPRSIEHWWDILSQKDVVVCSTIRNFKNEISTVKLYRRFITDNHLPDAYNAITYFKKSETANKFFGIVKDVFENWSEYRAILKCKPDEIVTADWAYAIACHIIGKEHTMLPTFTEMSMVHMKQFINSIPTDNWTDTLIYEINECNLRVHTCPQLYPFHYHVKSFSDKILKNL